jgi:hypothetical protein
LPRKTAKDQPFKGEAWMGEYRLYCLNRQGKFTKSHEFEAESDSEALERSREMKLPVECELWSRNRLVAKLPPLP